MKTAYLLVAFLVGVGATHAVHLWADARDHGQREREAARADYEILKEGKQKVPQTRGQRERDVARADYESFYGSGSGRQQQEVHDQMEDELTLEEIRRVWREHQIEQERRRHSRGKQAG